jgi:hypothetical protein
MKRRMRVANISKKEIKRRRRKKLEELGYNPDHILCGKLSLQGKGASPKNSKYHGGITNQKGAFGNAGWSRGLDNGVYQTFTLTNHERHLRDKRIAEAKSNAGKGTRIDTPLAREL